MDITIADPESREDESEAETERVLSDNVLVVEVSGPDVHGLSVVDFPGLMHSMSFSSGSDYTWLTKHPDSSLHDAHEIEAIRSLVMEYIKEPHTIILCACPTPHKDL